MNRVPSPANVAGLAPGCARWTPGAVGRVRVGLVSGPSGAGCGDSDDDDCDDCAVQVDGFGEVDDVDPLRDGLDTDGDGECDERDDDGDTVLDCEGNRLFTDAEYEHAMRAGSATAHHNGEAFDLAIGWFEGNANGTSHPVADTQNRPDVCNAWGLCDMAGNVQQRVFDVTCNDDSHASLPDIDPLCLWGDLMDHRVQRGGAYSQADYGLQSSRRKKQKFRTRSPIVGLRYVRALPCDDPDGDLFGEGLGCYADDCAPEDPDVNEGLGNCPE